MTLRSTTTRPSPRALLETAAGWAATAFGAWLGGHWAGGLLFWLCAYGGKGLELWRSNLFDQDRAVASAMALYGAEPDMRIALELSAIGQVLVTALLIAGLGRLTGVVRPLTRGQYATLKSAWSIRFPKLARAVAAVRRWTVGPLIQGIEIVADISPAGWGWAALVTVGLGAAVGGASIAFWATLGGMPAVMAFVDAPWQQLDLAVRTASAFPDHPKIVQGRTLAAMIGMLAGVAVVIGGAKLFGLADNDPLYGRARFGNWRELVKGQLLDSMRRQAGVLLGAWRRLGGDGPLVSHSEDWTHVFVLGPTGCGKGQGFVLPNALSWPDSLIAFDLKGEAWDKSAGWRASEAAGNRVFYFNPINADRRTCRFNPLGHVDIDDDLQMVRELKKVAEMLLPVPEVGEKFWAQSGQAGFVAAGMVIAERDRRLSIGWILEELKRSDLQEYFTRIAKNLTPARPGAPFSQRCQLQCSSFAAGSDEKTFGSKRDTLTAALGLWDDPNVCAATETSDFLLSEMRRKKMSVYLCASAGDLKVLRPLYAAIFQLLYDQLTKHEPAKSDHGVLVILDEFARLGAMPDLQAAFALTRSYKVRFLVVVQSLNQLKDAKLYGVHGAEDISINCDTQIYFTPTRYGDAKELSEALGNNTVKSRSRSRSRGTVSTSESDQRKPLMSPQELMLYPEKEILLKTRGRRPFRLRKLRAWHDEPFRKRMTMAPPAIASLPLPTPPTAAAAELARQKEDAAELTGMSIFATRDDAPIAEDAEVIDAIDTALKTIAADPR